MVPTVHLRELKIIILICIDCTKKTEAIVEVSDCLFLVQVTKIYVHEILHFLGLD